MPISLAPRWHILAVLVLCALVSLVYAPVTAANYCGFDDFLELHRAAFEDAQNPDHIWTTAHRGGNKYRPIYRLANDVTYWWGHGSPLAFHLRNLFFHCLTVITVYVLGLVLFSWPVALAAALLFGVHPLTHQAVAVAVFYNPAPNMQFLLTIALFLVGYQSPRPLVRWLAIGCGLLSGTVALFTYEPSLVAFGLLYAYLVIDYLITGKQPGWRFVGLLTVGVGLAAGSYFVVRAIFLAGAFSQNVITPPGIVLRNLTMYISGLFLPVDSVLAHDWLGTPLPRDIRFTALLWAFLALVTLIVGSALWFFRRPIAERLRDLPRTSATFLVVAILASLSLFLLFTDHASETYVAVPAAFFSLLLCGVLWQWFRAQPLQYGFLAGAIILMAALACLNRGERVVSCGETVARILADLPPQLASGPATLWMSNYPGEDRSLVYGIYGYKGLDTIGPDSDSVQAAIQTMFRNPQLEVRRVSPAELVQAARQPTPGHYYYFVHSDGTLSSSKLPIF